MRKIHQKLNSRFVRIQHAYGKSTLAPYQISSYFIFHQVFFFFVKPFQYVFRSIRVYFHCEQLIALKDFLLRKYRCFVSSFCFSYTPKLFFPQISFLFFCQSKKIKFRDKIYTRPFIRSVTYWLKYNSANTSFLFEHFLGVVCTWEFKCRIRHMMCIVVFLVFHICGVDGVYCMEKNNNNNRELMTVNDCFDDCVRDGSRHAHTKSFIQIYGSVRTLSKHTRTERKNTEK